MRALESERRRERGIPVAEILTMQAAMVTVRARFRELEKALQKLERAVSPARKAKAKRREHH
jgi:hypothetical protein